MTKNELLSFIAFKNEQEKEEAEFYMAVKGVELHRRILDYLGCDFEKSKIIFRISLSLPIFSIICRICSA